MHQLVVPHVATGSFASHLPWLLAELIIPVVSYIAVKSVRRTVLKAKESARIVAIIQSCGDAILSTAPDGTVTSWNPGAERMFGYAAKEMVGRNVAVLFPPELAHYVEPTPEQVASSDYRQEQPSKRLTKAGQRIDVSVVRSPLRNSDGQLIGVTRIIRDVSDFRRMADELQKAKEEAEAANRAKSIFLATMSHEIRTPMTAVIGYAELLQTPNVAEADRLKWTQTVESSARRLLDILNDVLDLSKIEAGQMDLRTSAASPAEIVDEVLLLLRPQAQVKNLNLQATILPDVPHLIETDAVKVRQILINLVGNAIKFTSQGGVELVVRAADLGHASQLYFDVSDTGPGISPEMQQRLFKPFVQGDASNIRRHGGTGLGLVISSRLARMLGGDLTVTSAPGRGSTFTASITAVRVSEPAVERFDAQMPAAPHESLAGRVLVVDDAAPIRNLVQQYLQSSGLAVVTAEDGKEGLSRAMEAWEQKATFDMILMDIQMPELDGYEAVRRLRSAGYIHPIIAITASALEETRSECLAAGYDDVLTKPFRRDQLMAAIDRRLTAPSAGRLMALAA